MPMLRVWYPQVRILHKVFIFPKGVSPLTPWLILKYPGLFDNTFANRLKRPHGRSMGLHKLSPTEGGLKSLQAAEAAFECNSDTMRGYWLFDEGIV